jgi:hypothetical protein
LLNQAQNIEVYWVRSWFILTSCKDGDLWKWRGGGGQFVPIGMVNKNMTIFRATVLLSSQEETLKMEEACSSRTAVSTHKTTI